MAVAVADSGDVYVTGTSSDNAFRITPGGEIIEILDAGGDGAGNGFSTPDAHSVAVDAEGTAYVSGYSSDNVFRVPLDGGKGGGGGGEEPAIEVTRILDSTGNGVADLVDPDGIAVAASGDVYVAGCGHGTQSSRVFRVRPNGTTTLILDGTGDGAGNALNCPVGVEMGPDGSVYVAGYSSSNVFRIRPNGNVSVILDASDGIVNPIDLAVDAAGNVYASGWGSDNAVRVSPGGQVTEIVDASGDGGANTLSAPFAIDVDAAGNVLLAGNLGNNAFKAAPGGAVTAIIDVSGDGSEPLLRAHDIVSDAAGNVYVSGNNSDNIFRIAPDGTVTLITNNTMTPELDNPTGIAIDGNGILYTSCFSSNNVVRIIPSGASQVVLTSNGPEGSFAGPSDDSIDLDADGNVYVTGTSSNSVFKIELHDVVTDVVVTVSDGRGGSNSVEFRWVVTPGLVERPAADGGLR